MVTTELIKGLVVVNFLESALDKCLTFFIITTSLILLLICVLGFSIYHVVMIKGELTRFSLLNHLYMIMAVQKLLQIQFNFNPGLFSGELGV